MSNSPITLQPVASLPAPAGGSDDPFRVLYDASVLGVGNLVPTGRTGIFRVVENVALQLATSSQCELQLCAGDSFHRLNLALDYIEAEPRLQDVAVVAPAGAGGLRSVWKVLKEPRAGTVGLARRKVAAGVARAYGLVAIPLPDRTLQRAQVYHSPLHPLPARLRRFTHLRRFLTIYDLIALAQPQWFEAHVASLIRRVVASVDRDTWILTISEATRNDICERLPVDPDRIFVAPPAASTATFHPCRDTERIAQVRARYGLPEGATYLLSVNTLEPRKNLDHAIRCFARVVQEHKMDDLYLLLVGSRGWSYQGIFDAVKESRWVRDRIVMAGYVADEDLAPLYSGALAFVYPSLYEGFGLPPLEAMQCGVPVVTSNTSSLPEVVGDAGIMVDPRDADALCDSLLRLYQDTDLAATLRERGLARAQRFSWDRCGQQTVEAYRTALG